MKAESSGLERKIKERKENHKKNKDSLVKDLKKSTDE